MNGPKVNHPLASLEWMPQSSQVSDLELAEMLAKEYYPGIFRLAVALLGNRDKAQAAALASLAQAVINRHRFWGETSLSGWVYSFALKAINSQERPHWFSRRNRFEEQVLSSGADPCWVDAYSSMGKKERLVMALHYLLGLSIREIGEILQESTKSLHQLLIESRSHLRSRITLDAVVKTPHALVANRIQSSLDGLLDPFNQADLDEHLRACKPCRLYRENLAHFEEQIEAFLSQCWPPLNLSNQELQAQVQMVNAEVSRYRKNQGFSLSYREILLIFIAVVMVAGLGWATGIFIASPSSPANRRGTSLAQFFKPFTPPSSSEGVFFLATGFPPPDILSQPTAVTPVPLPALLTEKSSSEEVRQRVIQSNHLWSTLWVDATIIDYGPLGYVGPPQVYHNRVWDSQPDRMIVLAGPLVGAPDYLRIAVANSYYEAGLKYNVAYYPHLSDFLESSRVSSPLLNYTQTYADRGQLYGFYLPDQLFDPASILREGELQVVSSENILNRPILVADHLVGGIIRDRFWIDAQMGTILGFRKFNRIDPQVVDRDIFINAISYNINFPTGFFAYDPESMNVGWQDIWTPVTTPVGSENLKIWESPTGRATGKISQPPASFDPSHSRLTFYWSSEAGAFSVPGSNVNIVAGNYSLGTVTMGDPLSMVCKRSPDGKFILFIDRPDIPFYAPLKLSWISLANVKDVHNPFPEGYTSSDAAFSPDSRFLAFFGCSQKANCGVYIHDLVTQENRKLFGPIIAAYFTWSPDSQYLAMIGATDMSSMHTLVVRVSNSEIIYSTPFNWKSMDADPDSPTHQWGVSFPPQLTGLEGCVFPP